MINTNGTNREFKDRLFKYLFGNPEHKDWTLELCNALEGTNYADADVVEFTTIEDVVYMSMKNDVSFLLHNTMFFFEQQSTYNPNMPARLFEYAGMVYGKLMKALATYDPFSSKQQRLPDPVFYCFYNGTNEKEDRIELKLSDAFGAKSRGRLELIVDMININYGHNKDLLDRCKPMKEYAFLVARTRFHLKTTNSLEEAIDKAIDEIDDDAVIKPALINNRAEVKLMCITEYDEEKTLRGRYEEGREDGREEGVLQTLANLVKSGLITPAQAAAEAKMTETEFTKQVAVFA